MADSNYLKNMSAEELAALIRESMFGGAGNIGLEDYRNQMPVYTNPQMQSDWDALQQNPNYNEALERKLQQIQALLNTKSGPSKYQYLQEMRETPTNSITTKSNLPSILRKFGINISD